MLEESQFTGKNTIWECAVELRFDWVESNDFRGRLFLGAELGTVDRLFKVKGQRCVAVVHVVSLPDERVGDTFGQTDRSSCLNNEV